jgi:DNA-nicking Smr family endonuclease
MGKKRNKNKRISDQERFPRSVQFHLEEDAQDLFLAHLEAEGVPDKDEQAGLTMETPSARRKGSRRHRGQSRPRSIDLHGLTIAEAEQLVEERFAAWLSRPGQELCVRVITGKGRHSGPEGGVLAGHMHQYVAKRFGHWIRQMDESPDDLRLNGIPIRGYFEVRLQT